MSKPKSNSVLDALPENQRTQLESWLFEENISYKDASARLLADFNVRCAPSSVGEWYRRTAQDRMIRDIKSSRTYANTVVEEFKKNPADMYSALVNLVGQFAFEASMDGKKFDPETIFNFTKLVMTARKQELAAQTLALARERFELEASEKMLDQALRKKADEINSSPMSNSEKIAAMRREAFKSVDDLQKSGKVKIPKQ